MSIKSADNSGRILKKRIRKRMLKSGDIQMLIEQVRQRPILWNDLMPLRSSPITLNKAWDEVAKILQQDALACKSTWSSLRASLRYRRRNSAKNWEHSEALSFLTTNNNNNNKPEESLPGEPAQQPQMVTITVAGCLIHKYDLNELTSAQLEQPAAAISDSNTAELQYDPSQLAYTKSVQSSPAALSNTSHNSIEDCFYDVDFSLLLSLDADGNHKIFDYDMNQTHN